MLSLFTVFAETTTTVDYTAISSAVTSVATPELVVGIITAILGSALGLSLLWIGGRKIVGAIMSALAGHGINI